mgnify:CR=1 FL=1
MTIKGNNFPTMIKSSNSNKNITYYNKNHHHLNKKQVEQIVKGEIASS